MVLSDTPICNGFLTIFVTQGVTYLKMCDLIGHCEIGSPLVK